MTAKRDESRDIIVELDHNPYTDPAGRYVSGDVLLGEVEWMIYATPGDGNAVDGIELVRYVPHSQYAALEAENASLSKSLASVSEMLDRQTENMLALRELVGRIAGDDFDEFGANLIYEARDLIAKVTG